MPPGSQRTPRRARSVLHVNTRDKVGGAEGSAWNLFKAFQARGLDSWLAVGTKTSDDPNVLVIPNEISRNGWVRACLSIAGNRGGIPGSIRKIAAGLRWAGEPLYGIDMLRGAENVHYPGTRHLLDLPPRRPDILHCHNLHGRYFDLRWLPWLSRQLPVILNLRDTWALSGHCAGFQGCERWKTGCGRCPDLDIYPPLERDTTAANWSRKARIYARSRLYVTAPSQWMMDQIAQSMLHAAKSKLISNGIDIETFRPADRDYARRALDLPPDGVIVLISAHSSFKPLEPMFDVLRRLNFAGVRLTVVCLGKTQAPETLGQGTIIYRPYQLDPAAMSLYYQSADAYLQVATAEAFGKSIVESMACGTPVVVNAVAAIPELVTNLKTGMLVAAADTAALAEALARVLTDRELHGRIRAQGSEEARRRFSLHRQSGEFLDWYEEVIEDWTLWKRAVRK